MLPPIPLASLEGLPSGPAWVALGLSYLLGAVPFGLVAARLRGVDLRRAGSGNIGATNAGRVLGRPVGLAVFVLDLLKGWFPAFVLAPWAAGEGGDPLRLQVACAALAVLGHVFPVWLGFRGGKGVATASGALIAIDPIVFLVGGAAWLVVLGLTRYVGLSSICMGLAFVAAAWWRAPGGAPDLAVGTGLLAVLILVRHRSNIRRMLSGTEPKVGRPKGAAT
jgi:glycerol-3-phosphate acyltransferase PlsY